MQGKEREKRFFPAQPGLSPDAPFFASALYKPFSLWYNIDCDIMCERRPRMNIPKIAVGDRLELKKKHPCGTSVFEVLRVGSDIRVVCTGCGRDLVLPREKLEKAIRKIRPAASEGSVSPDHE